jgi:hypothetical protein
MKKCYRVKEERNILQTTKKRKNNWSDYILRSNYFLRHDVESRIEGTIEVTGRRGRRRKQLVGDLNQREDTEN